MRRMWAAGAAIVMCLALGGLPVAGQEAAGPGATMMEQPVAVFVESGCGDVMEVPVVCNWTASDPRLTGPMTHVWIRPEIDAGQITEDLSDTGIRVGWADAEVEGPEGDWTGYQYAVWSDDPTQLFIILSGHGAYEGWQFVASTIDPGAPGDSDWTGIMYQGEPPPFGPLADPPSA